MRLHLCTIFYVYQLGGSRKVVVLHYYMVPTIYLQGEHSLPCCQTEVSLQKILQLYVEYGLCNIVESVKYTHQFFCFFGKIFVNITFNSQNDFLRKLERLF